MMILSPFGVLPFLRTCHNMIGQFAEIVSQKFIQWQLVYITFTALIQEALKGFVKLDSAGWTYQIIPISQVFAVLVTLTGQSIRIANGIRVSLLNGIDIHGVKRSSEFGGIIAHDLYQFFRGLAVRAIEVPELCGMKQTADNSIDSLIITNKSGHSVSLSRCKPLPGGRFLSRETGPMPNKGLRMKRKIPYSLDKINYTLIQEKGSVTAVLARLEIKRV